MEEEYIISVYLTIIYKLIVGCWYAGKKSRWKNVWNEKCHEKCDENVGNLIIIYEIIIGDWKAKNKNKMSRNM